MSDFLIPLLLLLGVLIFIHELGHFIAAVLCGVKVEKFSLGFGPALLKKRIGETEYVIAALPLGGFVKMLGELPGEELPPEERSRAFNHQPPWQRIVIALAGPAMNFALPVFLIAAIMMVGLPTPTSRIGGVLPDSPAARAGLQPGDRILEVNGQELWRWSELTDALRAEDAPEVDLLVERDGDRRSVSVVRESDAQGRLGALGIQQAAPAALVTVIGSDSPAARAGLETGDRIVSVGDRPVGDLYALMEALASSPTPLGVEVRRRLGGAEETRRLTLRPTGEGRSLEALGLRGVDFEVRSVAPVSPARKAGLQEGDLFLSVDGEAVHSSEQLVALIRSSAGEPIELELLRDGERVSATLTPTSSPVQGEEGYETQFTIGVSLGPPVVGGEMRTWTVRNPAKALWMGTAQTVEMTGLIVAGIAEMVRGSIGVKQLAGPIGIGEIAADTFRASWLQFLSFMSLISVNLAILNLLPVPVLDGGTILLTSMEWIRGGPLPTRVRELAQTVGLGFILMLMGFAFWNDIARNWEGIVGFFQGLV